MEQFSVKKWGGENAAELTKSPQNVVLDFQAGIKQAIVVSAIRSPKFNTTDHLIDLGYLLQQEKPNIDAIKNEIDIIKYFHISIIEKKIDGNSEKIVNDIIKYFDVFLSDILLWLKSTKKTTPSKENDFTINTKKGLLSIIGFGEFLSAFIQEKVINNLEVKGLEAEVVDFDGIVNKILDNLGEDDLFKELSIHIVLRVFKILDIGKIPILPGYVPGFKKGYENTVGRGYTDPTAAMTATVLSKIFNVTLEIQKSVKGILSSDPRIINGETKLIESLDYITAKEITGARGAQAKLLHSRVLCRELQDAGVNIRIFDPFTSSEGTIITKNKNSKVTGIEYIGGRKNVTFFSISSGKMSGTGILSNVFNIVKDYSPVDIISTSETEISFTIEGGLGKEKLDIMVNKITEVLKIKEDGYENFVKYEENKALIFCIGQNLQNNKGILGKAAGILGMGNINIEMVSQGIMERAIVFGIDGNKMKDAIRILHDGLIDFNKIDIGRRKHGIIV